MLYNIALTITAISWLASTIILIRWLLKIVFKRQLIKFASLKALFVVFIGGMVIALIGNQLRTPAQVEADRKDEISESRASSSLAIKNSNKRESSELRSQSISQANSLSSKKIHAISASKVQESSKKKHAISKSVAEESSKKQQKIQTSKNSSIAKSSSIKTAAKLSSSKRVRALAVSKSESTRQSKANSVKVAKAAYERSHHISGNAATIIENLQKKMPYAANHIKSINEAPEYGLKITTKGFSFSSRKKEAKTEGALRAYISTLNFIDASKGLGFTQMKNSDETLYVIYFSPTRAASLSDSDNFLKHATSYYLEPLSANKNNSLTNTSLTKMGPIKNQKTYTNMIMNN